MRSGTALSSAALAAFAAAGCALSVEQVGPQQPVPSSVEELARIATARVEAIRDFHDQDAGADIPGVPITLPARIYLREDGCLRLQLKRQAVGDDLAIAILNGMGDDPEFQFINFREKKGYRGVATTALGSRLSDLGLALEDFSPMMLFFPRFTLGKGDRAAMIATENSYIVETWNEARGPRLHVEVDAWSLTPTAMKIFGRDDVLAEFSWSALTWNEDHRVVVPRRVAVGIPARRRTFKLLTHRPRINKGIRDAAFRLRRYPGIEEKTLGEDDASPEGSAE
jgi:hypothetical protein